MKEDNSDTHKLLSSQTIPKQMLSMDAFSQWLGIEIVEVGKGYCKVQMSIRKEMLNSMGKAHGGICYSLADTAFGFAANTFGQKAVSIETSVNHVEALEEGDVITAESDLKSQKNKLGFYMVEVKKENQLVAIFKGVSYKTGAQWNEKL